VNLNRNGWFQKLRDKRYQVPAMVFDPHFVVKVADTRDELESAFRLLGGGIQLKCSIYMFLPQTSTIVTKYKGTVVGAMVLVKDSPLGLPSDQYFTDENTSLRHQGLQLVEITNMGVDPSFKQQNESLQHLLMKYSYQFARKYMAGNVLLMNVHPQSAGFYTKVWGFQRLGDVVNFKSAKNSLTVLLTWNLNKESKRNLAQSFATKDPQKNVALFLSERDTRMLFPILKEGQVISPVMTPDLLEYFFVKKSSVYEELTLSARKLFLEIFLQFYGEEKIQKFLSVERDYVLREFRVPTSTKVVVQAESACYMGKIIDITTQGCFIEMTEELRKEHHDLTLSFKLGDQTLSVTGKALWRNQNQLNRYPIGYGVKFDAPKQEILTELQSWVPRPFRSA